MTLKRGVHNAVMRVISLMGRLLPDRMLARILPRRISFDPNQLPPPPAPPTAPVRLLIAPVNWAGQAWQWARAAEAHLPNVGAVTMAYRLERDFGFPADVSVPVGGYVLSGRWQHAHRQAVLSGFSHVIVEAGRHVFGRIYDQSVVHQLNEMRAARIQVALLCHGSDIRLPSRHAQTEPWSPFLGDIVSEKGRLEAQARDYGRLIDETGLPVFVSTPDLLIDVPDAVWLPVVITPDVWHTDDEPLRRQRPVVAHAPSRGTMKGSELIDPILRRLDLEGLVEYRRVENVPADEMPSVYRDSDIILDQFRIGSYGVAACEGMAAGRLIVGHVSEQVRTHVKGETGLDLPIVEATADSVEAILRRIVEDPDRYRIIASSGQMFVQAVHNGELSAKQLRPFLDS